MSAHWPAEAAPVERALDLARGVVPDAAGEARQSLAEALRPIDQSPWPNVAWRFSRLNGDGFPAEFTFSTADSAIRYSAEIAGPEVDEHDRYALALRWAGWESAGEWHPAQVLRRQQGPLRWGAWIGGMHSGSGGRRKVYVEATPAFQVPVFPAPPGARLRFAGLANGGRDCEFYFRRDFLEVAEVGRMLCGLGLRECFHPLVESVANTIPWPVRERLLPTDSGFSIAPGRAFSVFTYARSLWGSDGSIRRRMLELAAREGADFRLYEAVSRPLASSAAYCTRHSILAWIVSPRRPVELRITLRPPPG
jgi:hypothetical protein